MEKVEFTKVEKASWKSADFPGVGFGFHYAIEKHFDYYAHAINLPGEEADACLGSFSTFQAAVAACEQDLSKR